MCGLIYIYITSFSDETTNLKSLANHQPDSASTQHTTSSTTSWAWWGWGRVWGFHSLIHLTHSPPHSTRVQQQCKLTDNPAITSTGLDRTKYEAWIGIYPWQTDPYEKTLIAWFHPIRAPISMGLISVNMQQSSSSINQLNFVLVVFSYTKIEINHFIHQVFQQSDSVSRKCLEIFVDIIVDYKSNCFQNQMICNLFNIR